MPALRKSLFFLFFFLFFFCQGVQIFETYHPGAVVRVALRAPDRSWQTVWAGDPQRRELAAKSRIFEPALAAMPFRSAAMRLDLDCREAGGWSEIDAVRILFRRFFSVSDHQKMTPAFEAAMVTALLCVRRTAEAGLLPFLSNELMFVVFEFLSIADWNKL